MASSADPRPSTLGCSLRATLGRPTRAPQYCMAFFLPKSQLHDSILLHSQSVSLFLCPMLADDLVQATVNLPILPTRPQKISTEIQLQPGRPCCSECFRKAGDVLEVRNPHLPVLMKPKCRQFTEVAWADDTVAINNLRALLDLMPDAAPCDLAVILRKPCREVCYTIVEIY